MKLAGPRFVCVGLNKSGTTSIATCFEILGLGPVARPGSRHFGSTALTAAIFERADFESALTVAQYFRSFKDRPWNVWDMYQRLDRRFPGSYFVLVERDSKSWWASVERWLTVVWPNDAVRRQQYLNHFKVDRLDKASFMSAYKRYNDEVKAYFRESGKLLVMNLENGDGWPELCGFLRRPIPLMQPFPHVNRQK